MFLKFIQTIYIGDFYRHNNTFRYLLDFFYKLNFNTIKSASFIISAFIIGRLLFFSNLINSKSPFVRIFVSFGLVMMMSLSLGFSDRIYLGKFVGNVWHNSPFIIMMFFAVYIVQLYIECFIEDNGTIKKYILLSLFIFLCCFSKPNFVIAYIPACGLFIILDFILFHKNKKILLKRIKNGLLVCIPTLLFLVMIYFLEFGKSGQSSIVINILAVWKHHSGTYLKVLANFFLSLSIGFLCFILNGGFNNRKNIYLLLLLVLGTLYFLVFAETEQFFYDANFAFTYSSCGLIFNSFLIIDFYNNSYCYSPKKKRIGKLVYIMFILQIINGTYYLIQMINASSFFI